MVAGTGFVFKVRMIAVDAEIRQWSRRRALELVLVGAEWLTTVV